MTEALPSNLLMYVFEFLSLKDYKSLIMTCKRFSQTILNHNKFWVRECLTKYMSFDLELYSETYDSDDYKSYIQSRIFSCQKNAWKQLLEDGETQKSTFAMTLAQIVGSEETESFVDYFYQTLKQPNLPMANLKRETICRNTQTLFQTKLSEVLYEDSGLVSKKRAFFDPYRTLIDDLQNHDKQIFQEMLLYDKTEILKARWYHFTTKESADLDETICFEDKSDMFLDLPCLPDLTKISNTSTEDLLFSKNKSALLMNLYDSICGVLTNYCGVINRYLSSLDDVYLLVAEYTARWKAYVCSMLELEKTLTTFTALMNSNYETIFEGHPCFPKFSIWRLMTKIWMREVYEKSNLNLCLTESFLKIMSNYRDSQIREAFSDCLQRMDMNEEKITELPKSVYVSLKIMKKQKSFKFQHNVQLVNSTPLCFKSSPEMERILLGSFLQSVLDISLNEVNIHYLDCTDMPANYPFCKLEEAILYQSNDFYKEYQQIFRESPEHFCHLLRSDAHLLSTIIDQRTNAKLEQVQGQNGLEIMRDFVLAKLDELDEEQLRKCEKQQVSMNEQGDELGSFTDEFVRQALQEKMACQLSRNEIQMKETVEECNMEEEIQANEAKTFISKPFLKAVAAALEALSPSFKTNLGYLKQKLDFLQSLKEKDQELRQANIDKNIPCEMGDVDLLFYDLEKNVEIALLEKLYDDYILFKKQQEREGQEHGQEEEKHDLPPLEQFNNDLGLPDLGNDLDFLDFDNIDLMNLEAPTLRRAMY